MLANVEEGGRMGFALFELSPPRMRLKYECQLRCWRMGSMRARGLLLHRARV